MTTRKTKKYKPSGGAAAQAAAPLSPVRVSVTALGGVSAFKGGVPQRGRDVWHGDLAAVERIYRNCRYPESPTFYNFFDLYSRSPVAGRIVESFPNYTWSTVPVISDRGSSKRRTPFESAWYEFSEKMFGNDSVSGRRIDNSDEMTIFGENGIFYKLDILAGIGGEAMLLIGFQDGKRMDQPVTYQKGMKVAFHKILHNGQFKVCKYDEDTSSVRFGKPETYVTTSWKYGNDINESRPLPPGLEIHHSRVVIFKETRGLPYGVSRIKKSFNSILDIMKIAGASAEVYWLAAYAGVKVETDPEATLDDEDRNQMQEEVENYSEGLSRSLLLTGAKGELMYPAIVSPKDHFEMQMKLISIDQGIPQRFLIGSEAAKLASQQDTDNWNERVDIRRRTIAEPQAILPYIDRLVTAGVLPQPNNKIIKIDWTNKTSVPLRDRMLTARDAANALSVYTQSVGHKAMAFVDFLHYIMQWPLDLAMTMAENYDGKYFEKRAEKMLKPASPSQADQADTGGEGNNTNDALLEDVLSKLDEMNAKLEVMGSTRRISK